MDVKFCKTCGAALSQRDAYTWECNYCHNVYSDKSVKEETERLLRTLISEDKCEKVANLRRNLYDALNAEYTDSEEIVRICGEIKALLPDDFMANFYYTANHGTPKEICEAIRAVDVAECASYIDGIVSHIVKSMRSEYALPLQNLVERAYKNTDLQKFEALSTSISEEMRKVDESVYETGVPRDIFVAYSSKDMPKVEGLVEYLEENGLDCFVAARNLRHGRGSVQNYEAALHEAMDNCKCVVFVSSRNSRNMECDALKIELKRIKNLDIMNLPAEYKQNYEQAPYTLKKKRIEYRIDNEPTPPGAARVMNSFFYGLEYVLSPEAVLDRYDELEMMATAPIVKEAPVEVPEQPAIKYCAKCGTENPVSMKFCGECGFNEFVNTLTELELRRELDKMKKKLEEDAERARKEAEAKAAEEARRAAEAKAAEEARKAAELAKSAAKAITPDTPVNTVSGDDKYFNFTLLDDGTYSVELKSKSNCPENVIIPSSYNGKAVTVIASKAFKSGIFSANELIKSVVIPNSIKRIESDAFFNCSSLKSILIPDSVTHIGDNAFACCNSLTDVTIPESVSEIPSNAFNGCKALRSVTLPQSIKSIGSFAFLDCTELKEITFEGTEEEWKRIGAKLSEKIKIIFTKEIASTSEKEAPDKAVEADSDGVFSYTLLPNDTYSVTLSSKSHYKEEYVVPAMHNGKPVTVIGKYAFADEVHFKYNVGTKRIVLPEGITAIEICAFNNCKALTEINIPSSVCSIGKNAFYSCEALESISLPDSVTAIEDNTFTCCKKLSEVKLGKALTYIGESAFSLCGLKKITLPESLEEIGPQAFANCSVIESIRVPASVKKMGYAPFRGIDINRIEIDKDNAAYSKRNGCILKNKPLTVVMGSDDCIIPEETTSIGRMAFYGCHGISFIKLPDRVSSIGIEAFCLCSNLRYAVLSPSLRAITSEAFSGCSKLRGVLVHDSINSIGDLAFNSCRALNEIRFVGTRAAWDGVKNSALAIASINSSKKYLKGEDKEFALNFIIKQAVPAAVREFGQKAINEENKDLEKLYAFTFLPSETYSVALRDVTKTPQHAIIPARYNGRAVTEIAAKGFASPEYGGHSNLTEVTVPRSISKIGEGAFIGRFSLKSVHLPDTLTEIGDHAFMNCTALESMNIPEGLTSLGSQALSYTGLLSVEIPKGVTELKFGTLSGCKLRTLTLSKGFSYIQKGAFSRSQLKEIIFKGSREEWQRVAIDADALPEGVSVSFADGAMGEVSSPELVKANPSYSEADLVAAELDLILRESKNPTAHTFFETSRLKDGTYSVKLRTKNNCPKSVVITLNGVSEIGNNAFKDFKSLKSVVLPDGVKTIAAGAFSGCSALEEVYIPDSVTEIGEAAFFGCSSLKSIYLPSGLSRIGKRAFASCSLISEIYIPRSVTEIGEGALTACTSLKQAYVLASVDAVSRAMFERCSALEMAVLPFTSARIEDFAFERCSSLTFIKIPDNVTEIGEKAFSFCQKLKSLSLPASLTAVKKAAFAYCSALESVSLPKGLKLLGESAFENCKGLSHISLPEGIEEIGSYAVGGCILIKEINIPASVKRMGDNPFHTLLTEKIKLDPSNASYSVCGKCIIEKESGKLVVGGMTEAIPSGIKAIGARAFYHLGEIRKAVIPEGVTLIGDYAFSRCPDLRVAEIPESVKSLGTGVFENCQYLNSITFNGSATQWRTVEKGADRTGVYAKVKAIRMTDAERAEEERKRQEQAKAEEARRAAIEKRKATMEARKAEELRRAEEEKARIAAEEKRRLEAEYARLFHFIPFSERSAGNALETCVFLKAKGDSCPQSITIPAHTMNGTTVKINDKAFESCHNLLSVSIPDTVHTIGKGAFFGCVRLKSVSIPLSVTTIECDAFSLCGSSISIYISENVEKIVDNPFRGIPLDHITVAPGNKRYVKKNGCIIEKDTGRLVCGDNKSILTNDIKKIGALAFSHCNSLEKINIPESVTEIGPSAFESCLMLSVVNIGSGVRVIEKYAFTGCNMLKEITIPGNVENIGANAFLSCKLLKSVTLEEGVNIIGSFAFGYCPVLTQVTLPESITKIELFAFKDCTDLKKIHYNGSKKKWRSTSVATSAIDAHTSITFKKWF